MDSILVALAVAAAVAVGALLAYVLVPRQARHAARPERGPRKTRYEEDNEVAWNPWPVAVVVAFFGLLVAVVVLLGGE